MVQSWYKPLILTTLLLPCLVAHLATRHTTHGGSLSKSDSKILVHSLWCAQVKLHDVVLVSIQYRQAKLHHLPLHLLAHSNLRRSGSARWVFLQCPQATKDATATAISVILPFAAFTTIHCNTTIHCLCHHRCACLNPTLVRQSCHVVDSVAYLAGLRDQRMAMQWTQVQLSSGRSKC